MQISAYLTDIWGTPVTRLDHFQGLEVREPINDSRTAKCLLSMHDPAIQHVLPLKRLLKVTYGEFLIFWGYLTRPIYDFAAATVEVNAHDPTLKLKHHYHRFGDQSVDYGYPLDGSGYKVLIESSVPIEPQLDRDIPGNGILWGTDTSTPQGPKPTTNPPADTDGVWRTCERGANVWDTLTSASQTIGAPDFRFRPVDEEHRGHNTVIPPGFFCEFETADKFQNDRSKKAVFDYGHGNDSAENIVWEPDGDTVRNYFVQVNPGGEKHRDDEDNKALVHNEASWDEYGIYEGWESSGQKDKKKVLVAKATAWVRAYAWVPDFFTITPAMDRISVPRYGYDFMVGDLISVRAKRGYAAVGIVGRVTAVTFQQVDPADNTRLTLDVVPDIDVDVEEGDEGGGGG